MPTARELLALEERFDALTEYQKACVIKVQAKLRGWAQRHKSKARLLREAREKGGVWAQFSLSPAETLVETYRAHLGGPIASGTGDLYVASGHVCFYCDSPDDASARDGILFSPTKKPRKSNAAKPISLKVAYKEIAEVSLRNESWSESGVTLTMRDGSSMWFGGFYFSSSVKALIEAEWTRETVAKKNHAQALRTQMIMAASTKVKKNAADASKIEELNDELRSEREKLRRAEHRERDQVVEIEILRENEERLEKQKKKLVNQVRESEEECESLRSKATAANAARRMAEKQLADVEEKFDKKIDDILEEKNLTITELSNEVNRFKEMWQRDKTEMKSENEKIRQQASDLRNQRDTLVSEKSKLSIEIGELERELTKFQSASAGDSQRVCALEAELEKLRSENSNSGVAAQSLQVKYDKAMEEISKLQSRDNVSRSTYEVKVSEVESLQAQVESFRTRLAKKIDSAASLQAKYDEAMDEIAALKSAKEDRVMAPAPAPLANNDSEIKELKTQLGNKMTKIDALQSEIGALQSNRESTAATMATLQAKYEEAKRQLAAARVDKEDAAKTSMNEMHHREGVLRKELEAKTAKCEELMRDVDVLRTQRESSSVSIATLQAKLEEMTANLTEAKAQREAASAQFAVERKELEQALTEANETSASALSAVKAEQESMREAKEKSSVSFATLKARFEDVSKQLESSKIEIEKAATAREEAMEKMHEAQRAAEASNARLVGLEKSLLQVEGERDTALVEMKALTAAAKSAEKSELNVKAELAALRQQNEQLVKEQGTLEGRSKELEEKAHKLSQVEQDMAALKAELATTALQQEKWRQDVEYAKEEIARSRSKEEAHNVKFLDMLKTMSEAEREAASARAAESVARDYASRSDESVKEIQEREVRMRDELACMRVAYEKLSENFRLKTEEFSREVTRLEKSISEEENKVNLLRAKLDEAKERINTLEQANIQSVNKINKYKDTLGRQKEETHNLYQAYQDVCADLEETKRLLEREQVATRDMHMQKMLEKQRQSAQVGAIGARVMPVRPPLSDANRGGSPLNGGPKALPSIHDFLPSLANAIGAPGAPKAIASPTREQR
jgi:chromosome segregation ATPase